jgi:hypothetical protein
MTDKVAFAKEVSRGSFLKFAAIGLGLAGLDACSSSSAFADVWDDQGPYISPSTMAEPNEFRLYNAGGIFRRTNISTKPSDSRKTFFSVLTIQEGTSEQPSTAYAYTQEIIPYFSLVENHSGHNESTVGNDGRTGFPVHRIDLHHHGQGDAVAYNAAVLVLGNKPDATGFLAQPAGAILNGDVFARNHHVYLNVIEVNAVGYLPAIGADPPVAYECAAIGAVLNFQRARPEASQGETWQGVRVQTLPITGQPGIQSYACDAGFVLVGDWKVGLDFTPASFAPGKTALALKANDRIYFDAKAGGYVPFAQTPGGAWMEYDAFDAALNPTGINGFRFAVGNSAVLQVNGSAVTSLVDCQTAKADGQFAVPANGSFRLNGLNGNTYLSFDGTNIRLVKNGVQAAIW